MVKEDRIDNEVLLRAGLELMRLNSKPLTKLPSKGRSMLFELSNGETVRARTCNDHILIAFNPTKTAVSCPLPEGDWTRLIDTHLPQEKSQEISSPYQLHPFSSLLLHKI